MLRIFTTAVLLSGVFAVAAAAFAQAEPDGGVDATVQAAPDLPADGQYRLNAAAEVDRVVATTVEEAIRALHPSMRDPFRAQLIASLRAPRGLRLLHSAESLVITYDTTAFAAAVGGVAQRQLGAEGRPVQVSHRVEQGAVVQEVSNGQFRRIDRITSDASGIRLQIELRSGLLPRTLSVTATYAHDLAAPVDAGIP